ncbi:MAG: zinc-finger domain-containing protein [Thiotrichaceae bacterium]|nr:zinc-finger domain-containing protein [Thiotrichaceae bacterium]
MKASSKDIYQRGSDRLNTYKEVIVRTKDLPLRCPMSDDAVWCSHPRVSLAIESMEHQEISCPYCGTKYRLED